MSGKAGINFPVDILQLNVSKEPCELICLVQIRTWPKAQVKKGMGFILQFCLTLHLRVPSRLGHGLPLHQMGGQRSAQEAAAGSSEGVEHQTHSKS